MFTLRTRCTNVYLLTTSKSKMFLRNLVNLFSISRYNFADVNRIKQISLENYILTETLNFRVTFTYHGEETFLKFYPNQFST